MKDWWETAYQKVNSTCAREEVMQALNKTLALTPETYALMENTSAISYSGLVSDSKSSNIQTTTPLHTISCVYGNPFYNHLEITIATINYYYYTDITNLGIMKQMGWLINLLHIIINPRLRLHL